MDAHGLCSRLKTSADYSTGSIKCVCMLIITLHVYDYYVNFAEILCVEGSHNPTAPLNLKLLIEHTEISRKQSMGMFVCKL